MFSYMVQINKKSCEFRCYPATNTLTPDNSKASVPEPIEAEAEEEQADARGADEETDACRGWGMGAGC